MNTINTSPNVLFHIQPKEHTSSYRLYKITPLINLIPRLSYYAISSLKIIRKTRDYYLINREAPDILITCLRTRYLTKLGRHL